MFYEVELDPKANPHFYKCAHHLMKRTNTIEIVRPQFL